MISSEKGCGSADVNRWGPRWSKVTPLFAGSLQGATHSLEPPSSTEPPINFNTNTGSGLPRASAAITHEVMPFWLTGGVSGVRWGGFQVPGVVCPAWLRLGCLCTGSTCTPELSFSSSFSQKL